MGNTQAAASKERIDKLATFSAATIHEVMGKKGAFPAAIKPISPTMKLCGAAYTIQSMPGDNLLLHRAIASASTGDVLVADMSGHYESGYWGEILTVASQARGIAGLVIDGCVRDSSEIEALGFPVFCRGLCIQGTTKHGTGTLNQTITIGGVRIEPGDIVLGDRDGLVVVPAASIEETIAKCEVRVQKEKRTMQAIRDGKTTLEIYGWE
jgi:4-hydroxy-4-methyl-2-oxoglutarate aldolase